MAGDDDAGVDLLGELGDAGGRGVSAPDELVDGADAAGVIGAFEGAVKDGEIELGDLRVAGKAVAEEQPRGGANGQREGEEKLGDGDVDHFGLGAKGVA